MRTDAINLRTNNKIDVNKLNIWDWLVSLRLPILFLTEIDFMCKLYTYKWITFSMLVQKSWKCARVLVFVVVVDVDYNSLHFPNNIQFYTISLPCKTVQNWNLVLCKLKPLKCEHSKSEKENTARINSNSNDREKNMFY